jgi:hypothetical protein
MREANPNTTTPHAPPRRLLLSLAAQAPIAVFATSAVAADNPDAELIRLGELLERAWARENAAAGREDEQIEAVEVTTEIVDQIEAQTATMLAGVQVKVRALLWCGCGDLPSADELMDYRSSTPATDMRLLADLVRDLAAMGRA